MTTLHHFIGLVGSMMLLIAIPLTLVRSPRFKRGIVLVVFFLMSVLAVIEVNGLITAAYIRAVTGDLSITSMVLLAYFIAEAYTGIAYVTQRDRKIIRMASVALAALLYPFALGLGYWDSYAGGFGSWWLYVLLFFMSAWLWYKQAWFPLSLLLVVIMAYMTDLLESDNLWDYLIDPWLTMVMLYLVIVGVIRKSRMQVPIRTD